METEPERGIILAPDENHIPTGLPGGFFVYNALGDQEIYFATLLQQLGAWGEKKMYGRTTMGILRTTYLVNEEGIVEHIFLPKQIKTKIHAEQILDYIKTDK